MSPTLGMEAGEVHSSAVWMSANVSCRRASFGIMRVVAFGTAAVRSASLGTALRRFGNSRCSEIKAVNTPNKNATTRMKVR